MTLRNVDFSAPLQARRWLRYLREDPVSGIRILPDLDLPKRRLGFSLRSNAFGLRGPADPQAEHVIAGTSFAMGFAVDNGRNWYDLALAPAGWLNLGLPVGMRELLALHRAIHRGPGRTLLFLYHPNVYMFTRNYERVARIQRETGCTFFDAMEWETRLGRCLELTLRNVVRERRGLRAGTTLRFRHAGRTYTLNALYNRFDFALYADQTEQTLASLQELFARFERTFVVRVFLKQELVPDAYRNAPLRETIANYEQGWQLARQRMRAMPQVSFHEPPRFELSDYHPGDTHWNDSGNRRFADFVRAVLRAERPGSVQEAA